MPGFPGIFEALLLIALGFGYIVLYFAKREEGAMQYIGYIAGSAIMLLATLYLIGSIYFHSRMDASKMRIYKETLQQKSLPSQE